MSKLLHPDEALQRILARCQASGSEAMAPADALGRVLAQPCVARESLPPFHNSAMDGFAFSGGDETLPASSVWPVLGEQAAGDEATVGGTGAVAIMTGARLPEGMDRVIPVERTEKLDDPPRVRILAEVAPQQNVRAAGSDVPAGETVLNAGTVLAPQQLMLLAGLGVPEVEVARRPRVAVLSTGRELVDDPAQPLASGQIRNSNRPFLASRVPLAGAELVHAETVGDDVDAFLVAFARAHDAGARVVLSTGAVSMGRYDFVPQALERLGAEVIFHKIAIRPGKPLLFACLPDGTLFFGLPGNPIATAAGLRFFVEPALRAMLGLPPEQPWHLPLANDWQGKPTLRYHLKARVGIDAAGQLAATILPGQQSYRIRPYADANAWVVVPLGSEQLATGTLVEARGMGHLESPRISDATPA